MRSTTTPPRPVGRILFTYRFAYYYYKSQGLKIMDYVPTTHKFVAVLNKKVPVGNLMNALGHITAGFAASYPNQAEMRFDNYADADGNAHPNISDNPFIVL